LLNTAGIYVMNAAPVVHRFKFAYFQGNHAGVFRLYDDGNLVYCRQAQLWHGPGGDANNLKTRSAGITGVNYKAVLAWIESNT
jgi:hypothetical protein